MQQAIQRGDAADIQCDGGAKVEPRHRGHLAVRLHAHVFLQVGKPDVPAVSRLSEFDATAEITMLQENGSASTWGIEDVFVDSKGHVVIDPHGTGYA